MKRNDRRFEKTGALITADGTEDHLIQPEGTVNYSLDGPVAPPKADEVPAEDADGDRPMADGKDAKAESKAPKKKAAAKSQSAKKKSDSKKEEEEEEDDEEEEDSEEDEDKEKPDEDEPWESDDEPDSDAEHQSLVEALPDGFSVVDDLPKKIGDWIVGKRVLFRYRSHGWECAAVMAHFAKTRGPKKFNVELLYDDGDEQRPHRLTAANYSCADDAPPGSWCLVEPNRR